MIILSTSNNDNLTFLILNDGINRSSFDNINLSGANLNNVTIKNSNIRNAIFIRAKISGCNFESSDFEGSNFKDAFIYDNNFKNTNLSGAIIDSTRFCYFFNQKDGIWYYQIDSKNNLSHANISNAKIQYSTFCNVDFSGSEFNGGDIKNTLFKNCNFNHVNVTDFRGLEGSKNINIENSEFQACSMDSINIQSINHYGCNLRGNRFIYNNLCNSMFLNVDMKRSVFLGNKLTNTSFVCTELSGVRFWDKNNPEKVYEQNERDGIIMRAVLFNKKDYIEKNLIQIADMKTISSSSLDSLLYLNIKKYRPGILEKVHYPYSY